MMKKQEIEQQIQSQLKVWQAQIVGRQERMQQAGEEARANIEKVIAQLKEQAEQARSFWSRCRRPMKRL
jgi:cob(I)alamin adenosyltransferase